jgi:AraC-like DNA-binding protein
MTAVVVDLRSEGHILAELNGACTKICISLEEIGGIFQISESRYSPQRATSGRGSISVIPPGSAAYGQGNGLTFFRQLILQVDRSTVARMFGQLIDVEAALAPRTMVFNHRIRLLSRIIAAEFRAGAIVRRSYGDSLTMAILSALEDAAETSSDRIDARGGLAPWRLSRVIQHLLDNLSENMELDAQAEIAGLSKSHYGRAFKASMGMSPHQWLLNARVDRAKHYLLAGQMPLSEIALAVGFTDQAHFTHTFSRIEGIGPRSWQRTHYAPSKK